VPGSDVTLLFTTLLVFSPLYLSFLHLTFLFTCLFSILKAPHSALLFSPTPQAPQHTSKTSSSLATLFSEWTATGSSFSVCSLPPSTTYLCPSFSHAPPQHPRHERRECARAHPGPHRHYGISSIMPAPIVSLIPSGRCSRHSALAPPHPPSPSSFPLLFFLLSSQVRVLCARRMDDGSMHRYETVLPRSIIRPVSSHDTSSKGAYQTKSHSMHIHSLSLAVQRALFHAPQPDAPPQSHDVFYDDGTPVYSFPPPSPPPPPNFSQPRAIYSHIIKHRAVTPTHNSRCPSIKIKLQPQRSCRLCRQFTHRRP
jgi:hypothetical protein